MKSSSQNHRPLVVATRLPRIIVLGRAHSQKRRTVISSAASGSKWLYVSMVSIFKVMYSSILCSFHVHLPCSSIICSFYVVYIYSKNSTSRVFYFTLPEVLPETILCKVKFWSSRKAYYEFYYAFLCYQRLRPQFSL